MNANELADELEAFHVDPDGFPYMVGEAIAMLRQFGFAESIIKQQQVEIEALKSHTSPYKAITNTKIDSTVVSYTHPYKELTSCEFENIIDSCDISGDYDTQYDFDKMFRLLNEAILRKAQEK